FFLFFFFQAEDGIRYFHVTGVQTCALPICGRTLAATTRPDHPARRRHHDRPAASRDTRRETVHIRAVATASSRGCPVPASSFGRSEERRVGKACSSTGLTDSE